MKNIFRHTDKSYWYNLLHYHVTKDMSTVLQEDLEKSNIDPVDIKGKTLVVSFLAEGHDHSVAEPVIQYLQQQLPDTKIIVVYNTINDSDLPYEHRDFPTHLVNSQNYLELVQETAQVDCKFLCLMRRPSPSRAALASAIYNMPSVRLSFGSMYQSPMLREYENLFDVPLPITIDGIVDYDKQHRNQSKEFFTCLFNIVVESSSQTDPGIWRSLFISEKTFKAFGFRQIPVWFAVPGLVSHVRKLGFDLFDDIVDHSYDSIADESTRLQSLVNQIKKLDAQYSLAQCQQLKIDLWPRIQNNFQLLRKLEQKTLDLDL